MNKKRYFLSLIALSFISVLLFFSNHIFAQYEYKISPDGKKISYLAPSNIGRTGLWIKTPGKDDGEFITDKAQGIYRYYWAFDSRHILYLRDSDGDENFHLYAVDTKTKTVKDLTPFANVKVQNLQLEKNKPGEILIGLNKRNKQYFDMHRIDLNSYKVEKDTENPGDIRWWLADPGLEVRAAVAISPEDARTTLRIRDSAETPWRDVIVWPFGETGLLEGYGSEIAVAFSADGNRIYIQSAYNSDLTNLAEVDTKTGKFLKIIASDTQACIWNVMGITLYDKAQVLFHPETREVQAVGFNYLKPEWKSFDSEIENDLEILRKTHKGTFDIVNRDNSGEKWIVQYFDDNSPGAYYLYDKNRKKAELLTRTMTNLNEKNNSAMEPVIIKARDGLNLPCYLSLPAGVSKQNLPLILLVHGGPWARDEWGYNGFVQWLTKRGYAVLQVNFRGSVGFGKKFLNAGNSQWGVGSMQHDLTDAVNWTVNKGIADPHRIAIIGGSYGGYAVLAGLAFTPDLYTCGIDICGISNVKTAIETMPEWWAPIKRRWLMRAGNVLEDNEFNRKISPYFHVDKIKAKLMIFHGANDPRVPVEESDQMVKAMREKGLNVTYITYPDEGHGIRKTKNYRDYMKHLGKFLAENLKNPGS